MRSILLIVLLLGLFPVAQARTVEGVALDESATARDGTRLQLHGAGVRDKFIFDIYVGALYLTSTGQKLETILASDQPARIEMHFVYSEVEAEKLRSAWRDGFAGNNDEDTLDAIGPRLDRFVELFPTAVEGDVFALEYLPGKGTEIVINGTAAGTIEGAEFFRALLGVFLGPRPADKKLKRGMLGDG